MSIDRILERRFETESLNEEVDEGGITKGGLGNGPVYKKAREVSINQRKKGNRERTVADKIADKQLERDKTRMAVDHTRVEHGREAIYNHSGSIKAAAKNNYVNNKVSGGASKSNPNAYRQQSPMSKAVNKAIDRHNRKKLHEEAAAWLEANGYEVDEESILLVVEEMLETEE